MSDAKTPEGWFKVERAIKNGWSYRMAIQYHIAPKQWPGALQLTPESIREETEDYLRSIAERMRVVNKIKRGD